jgi:signal transduction histidine kinase
MLIKRVRSTIVPVSTIRLHGARLVEFLIVMIATAPALIDQGSTDSSPKAWWALSAYVVVAAGTLAVRKLWPLASFGIVLVTLAGAEIWCATQEVQMSNLAVLPLAFSVYAVGAHCRLPVALTALAGGATVVCVGVAINHATAPIGWRGGSDVFATIAPIPVAWALGVVAQSHQLALEMSEQRAASSERERERLAEQAVAAERGRIARDMHDVVAHSLTLLVVHAETIRARSTDLPPWAREQIDALAAAGRQATVEMRELLGILRNGTPEAAPRTPAPTLADVAALVEAADAAGNDVAVAIAGEPSRLPKPVQLAGYRVLQESLANARRHAPGSRVHVELKADDTRLDIEVVSGPPPRRVTPMPGEGIGLLGLKERVTALGGSLSAGPVGGGFRVIASIPVSRPQAENGTRRD